MEIYATRDTGEATGFAEAYDVVRFRVNGTDYVVDLLRLTVDAYPPMPAWEPSGTDDD